MGKGGNMMHSLNIACNIRDKNLAFSLRQLISQAAASEVRGWNPGKESQPAPEIVILEDRNDGALFSQLAAIQSSLSRIFVFVVSSNKDPKHIIEVMKKGGSEYFLAPIDREQFIKAVEEVRNNLISEKNATEGLIYTFISSKGGLGSTVLAVNTAVALAQDSKEEIAFWDMGFQTGDSLVLLDIVPERTIIDLCRNISRLDYSLLQNAMIRHKSGINLLAAPFNPEELEEISSNHIAKLTKTISTLYNRVVIDCSSTTITHSTVEAFLASEKVFIVIDLSIPAVRNASRISKLMQRAGVRQENIEFVVNRYVEGGALSVQEVQKSLGKRMFWLFPNDFNHVVSSINNGKPLFLADRRAALSKSISHFVEKLQNPQSYFDVASLGQKRFWAKIF
jgi:pilus assembly protein CpaE